MLLKKLALTLLLTTIIQPVTALNGYIPPTTNYNDDGGTTLVLVGYTDDAAHETILAQTKQMQLKGKKVKERKNHKFKRAHKVQSEKGKSSNKTESKSGKVGGNNLFIPTEKQQRRYLQEGALSRGYCVLEYDNSAKDIDIDVEIDTLLQIEGVVVVEPDRVAHIMTVEDPPAAERFEEESRKLLRGGSVVDHLKEIQEAIRATADQLLYAEGGDATSSTVNSSSTASSKNNSRNQKGVEGRRRLAEQTPYGIEMVKSAYVHKQTPPTNAEKIKICVVDTGYDLDHEDLPDDAEHGTKGYSPYGGNELWYEDGHGHGTHCAGTIGAIGDNDKGVTSVNPDPDKFEFLIGKGLTNNGSGSGTAVMSAVQWCVDEGAKVISMSLGGGGYSSNENSQFEDHYDKGVLIIAAAGNSGAGGYEYPASYRTVVSIGAVNSNKQRAGFSTFNDQVELSGPGVSVLSTLPENEYDSWSGTSMACPHVAGVAALLWYHFPQCNNNQIRNAMLHSAEDRGGQLYDNLYGWGIVNAETAYNRLNQGCVDAGGPYPGPNESLSSMAPGGKDQIIADPTPAPTPMPTNEGDSGAQSASYDASLEAPKCSFGYSCDSGVLLKGRGTIINGVEPNRPNTLNGCTDGNDGTYFSDESMEKIVVSQASGITKDMAAGDTVTITATVFCWDDGSSDYIDFYYASNAADPEWNQIGERLQCPGGGLQTVTASHTLPTSESVEQAVRVNLMYTSSVPGQGGCTGGAYDDTDDLVISVVNGPTPPPTSQPSSTPTTGSPTSPPTTGAPTTSPSPKPSSSPTSSPTARPSAAPTPKPTFSPTGAPSKPPGKSPTKNFSNTEDRDAKQKAKGIMFQMKAEEEGDVIVEKISFKTKDNKRDNVEIFFKLGSYSTFTSGGLNEAAWGNAVFEGTPSSSHLDGGLLEVGFPDDVVKIPAGTMGSFYLTGKKEFMYEEGVAGTEFDLADDTGDFSTFTGSSTKKPFEKRMGEANFVGGLTYHTLTEPTDPTSSPTDQPTSNPTASPSHNPTQQPTSSPSQAPTTAAPTNEPTNDPTASPSVSPTSAPSQAPTTAAPTNEPTNNPTASPSVSPTSAPSQAPTTAQPTNEPSKSPTASPTSSPSKAPTNEPSKSPTASPSSSPSKAPTNEPTTDAPTPLPSESPTNAPSTANPTAVPSNAPTDAPTSGVTAKEFTTDLNHATAKVKKGGIMFTITAKDSKDVAITGLGIIGAKTKESEVSIFMHSGSYVSLGSDALNEDNWQEVYSNDKLNLVENEIVDVVLQEVVNIPAGSTASLYVSSKKELMYSPARDSEFERYAESDDFFLNVGKTTKKEFKDFDKSAEFAGRFAYEA